MKALGGKDVLNLVVRAPKVVSISIAP